MVKMIAADNKAGRLIQHDCLEKEPLPVKGTTFQETN